MATARALILGIGGQDGSYLADILLEKEYEVHGLYRHSSYNNLQRIAHCRHRITLHQGDVTDVQSLQRVINHVPAPYELYNLADQDNVGWSYQIPSYNWNVTATAVEHILNLVRKRNTDIRVFQPVSATMFGNAPAPQNEHTAFNPLSPYACAKVAAHYIAQYHRQVHKTFVATAILYNHDSPRRGPNYLLQKICRSVAEIAKGSRRTFTLGNLDQEVDIGYAREYMYAAWQMLQQPVADNYVVGSGHTYTIRNLVRGALNAAGLINREVDEIVRRDPEFYRPDVSTPLLGNITKANTVLDFNPRYHGDLLVALIMDELNGKEVN